MSASLSVVFAGTPEFSVPTLAALVESRHRVVAVYTQPDQPAGRGQKLAASPVKQCALRLGLRLEQPPTLRAPAAVQTLIDCNADVMVVVAYGLLLPGAVLAAPRLGCLNIHASLLPRWRGAAPIQRALLAGDAETGITIMQMDTGLDTGPALLASALPIGERETAGDLHDRLATLGPPLLLQALAGLIAGTLHATPQPPTGMCYAQKIRKEEAVLDWSRPAAELDRQVRAFNPWPVAETRLEGEQLRVWEAHPEPVTPPAPPGSVVACAAEGVLVATGSGALRLTRVQLAGRKAMPASEFSKGRRLDGAVLGMAVAGTGKPAP